MSLRNMPLDLYQVHHPWHWLTYGQNGVALGLVLTMAVSAFTVIVLYRTLVFVNRQAVAAEDQATAARSAAKLAELQFDTFREDSRRRERVRDVNSAILNALADSERWPGPRPTTGAGDRAVRADELATALSLDEDTVVRRLLSLERRGRVNSIGGDLGDSTARWLIIRH